MRKLASVRRVLGTRSIPGADFIEVAMIDGWEVVIRKDELKPGDLCVYFEIDSFLPANDSRYEFLKKNGTRVYDGVEGMVLRTIKLRKQVSQGLALPLDEFVGQFVGSSVDEGQEICEFFFEGHDLTDWLGIKKYEKPVPTHLGGVALGYKPSQIPKTDEERFQNITQLIQQEIDAESEYEVSLKLDGTSCTFYKLDDHVGVCGRQLEFKKDESNKNNVFVRLFHRLKIDEFLRSFSTNYALQGEVIGPGIQGNREQLKDIDFYLFNVWNIDKQKYLTPSDRCDFLHAWYHLFGEEAKFKHVPLVESKTTLKQLGIHRPSDLLTYVEGHSLNNPIREGLVFKRWDGNFSFKVISNRFLLGEKDDD